MVRSSPSILLLKTKFVFIYPIISHCEQQLEKKKKKKKKKISSSRSELLSHEREFFIHKYYFIKERKLELSLVRHSIYEEHHPEAILCFYSFAHCSNG